MDALATRSEELLDDEFDEHLHLEFDLARLELVEARRAQQLKDTPAARLRVAECRNRVDRVLDMWNDALPAAR
jgi:hypothetical protein